MRSTLNILDVQRAVSAYYGLNFDALIGRSRKAAVSRPRNVAMTLAYELTPASLSIVGRHFGGRDRTTVTFAIKRVKHRAAKRPCFVAELESLRQLLNAREGLS